MTTHVHRYVESREDRNKRMAIEAITIAANAVALLGMARQGRVTNDDMQGALGAYYQRWEDRGVAWVRPGQLALDPDEWVTAGEMAAYLDKDPATVRRWAYRGHISTSKAQDGTPLYNVGEAIAYEAKRRARPSAGTCATPSPTT